MRSSWVLIALLAVSGEAWAHGGGLDPKGCHTNRSTGDYHCHSVGSAKPAVLEEFTGRCIGVVDGDTIKVMYKGKATTIRLYGIDAPEKRQPFGTRAKQTLGRWVFGKDVRVVVRGRERYGRMLAQVYFGSGKEAGMALVSSGLAWHYKKYSKDKRLSEAESAAKKLRRGVWSLPKAEPPWAYRRRK